MSLTQAIDYLNMTEHRVNEALRQYSNWPNVPEQLRDAMRYSLLAGGKRLRPALVLAVMECFGKNSSDAMPAACAIEMIHTYSLIHDDLPAMDDDDYRRNRLTNHKVYGEAMAILSGDALLTHAFWLLAKLPELADSTIRADIVLRVIEDVASHAGPEGMVAGQVLDMQGEQGVTTISELEAIHRRKTGDLIVCSLRVGGHLSEASPDQMDALTQFGYQIGLAFQIQDDLLDVIGDKEKLGKETNRDEATLKVTYPYLLGIDECKRWVNNLTKNGKESIMAARIPDPNRLTQLADFLVQRDR